MSLQTQRYSVHTIFTRWKEEITTERRAALLLYASGRENKLNTDESRWRQESVWKKSSVTSRLYVRARITFCFCVWNNYRFSVRWYKRQKIKKRNHRAVMENKFGLSRVRCAASSVPIVYLISAKMCVIQRTVCVYSHGSAAITAARNDVLDGN